MISIYWTDSPHKPADKSSHFAGIRLINYKHTSVRAYISSGQSARIHIKAITSRIEMQETTV